MTMDKELRGWVEIMNKFGRISIAFIIVCLIASISDYFIMKNISYENYLSGRYYFRYDAVTSVPGDPNYMVTPDDPMFYADYSNPRNMLLINSLDVLAYNPRDGFCTVVYGENVINDFPVTHISVSSEDYYYFYGTEQYTYEEYFNKLESVSDRNLSSEDMKTYTKFFTPMLIVSGLDIVLFAVLFFIRNQDDGFVTDLLLFCGIGYSFLFNVIAWSHF